MTFSAAELLQWLAGYVWPFVRIGAMLTAMAAIGTKMVPLRIRTLLTFAVTLVVVPTLPAMPEVALFSVQGMLITALQVLVGVAMGFVSVMVMQVMVLAGQVIAFQASLGFAAMVDPVSGQQTPVVSQFFLNLAILIFFAINGHLWMLEMLHHSFFVLPVGSDGIGLPDFHAIALFGSTLFASALGMAIAEIIALLLINLAFGFMTRAAPQLNIFTIGFPIIMLSGLLILWVTAGTVLEHFLHSWQQGQSLMCDLLGSSC
ncbi:flagellar biosynthetic protein FliR [Gallaecimonas sp. GXIMD4217]|uniref:flagellar biosynthetic protein FliR n=1 Tax=Gallaecimonas sp. GXIMD4217 TaxID=3131927 RepID=UPI00311AC82C